MLILKIYCVQYKGLEINVECRVKNDFGFWQKYLKQSVTHFKIKYSEKSRPYADPDNSYLWKKNKNNNKKLPGHWLKA